MASMREPRAAGGPGSLVLEGGFLVERGIAAGLLLEELCCVPAREAWARDLAGLEIEPKVLPEARMAEIAGYPFHRGVFALARRPEPRSLADILGPAAARAARDGLILALPELVDPENLGAAFRNAAAFGCSALLLGPSGPDPYSRRCLRVSMGAALGLGWARLAGPEGLREAEALGYEIAACVLDPGAKDLRAWEAPERLALVLGNEAFGLSPPWLEACGERVTLPMLGGTDSLNVATAAAVFLYAARERRP